MTSSQPLVRIHRAHKGRVQIDIGNVTRMLPLVRVPNLPGQCIAVFNILGDWQLTEAAGGMLAMKVPQRAEVLLMPDGKAQALLHVMGRDTGLPTVCARKTKKSYMTGKTISASVRSVTSDPQQLFLDEASIDTLRGKRVVIVDDVISSGATIEACRNMVEAAGATFLTSMAIFEEGKKHEDTIALGFLPLYIDTE